MSFVENTPDLAVLVEPLPIVWRALREQVVIRTAACYYRPGG